MSKGALKRQLLVTLFVLFVYFRQATLNKLLGLTTDIANESQYDSSIAPDFEKGKPKHNLLTVLTCLHMYFKARQISTQLNPFDKGLYEMITII